MRHCHVIDRQGRPVEVWTVSKTAPQPDWVKNLFRKNVLQWSDNRLKVLMPCLSSQWHQDSRYIGFGMYQMAELGDTIDKTNGKIVSRHYFAEHYHYE